VILFVVIIILAIVANALAKWRGHRQTGERFSRYISGVTTNLNPAFVECPNISAAMKMAATSETTGPEVEMTEQNLAKPSSSSAFSQALPRMTLQRVLLVHGQQLTVCVVVFMVSLGPSSAGAHWTWHRRYS